MCVTDTKYYKIQVEAVDGFEAEQTALEVDTLDLDNLPEGVLYAYLVKDRSTGYQDYMDDETYEVEE